MMPARCARSATMSRAETSLQAAWLIHRRPFRNTSLTVDLFLPALGRIGAVVRGGRKDPLLAPFTPLWVELKPSGEMYSLRTCEPRGNRLTLTGKALYCGFYLNELLTRLLPGMTPIHRFGRYTSRHCPTCRRRLRSILRCGNSNWRCWSKSVTALLWIRMFTGTGWIPRRYTS